MTPDKDKQAALGAYEDMIAYHQGYSGLQNFDPEEADRIIRAVLSAPEVATVTVDEIMKKIIENPHSLSSVGSYFEHAAKHYPNGFRIVKEKPPIVEGEK